MPHLQKPRQLIHSVLTVALWMVLTACASQLSAGVGDPQVSTDHVWYPGELACSTFDRLFATQARLYETVTGTRPATDEQKALAAWLWRNTHYFHGEEGAEDLWGMGFIKGGDTRTREYWTGLFAHGFGLCGTTHSQWVAEMQALLGHNRGRGVGVSGHNSFEVFLTGGAYGPGKWVMLDHDISAVAFDDTGSSLLSISEVQKDWKRILDRNYKQDRQHGWPVCGLHKDDASAFSEYNVAEYFAGYEGVPPIVHLRKGETMRRYLQPGLQDGKSFVFWGRNYNAGNIPGPERSLTWVNQPEKIHGGVKGVTHRQGQARFGNAVFAYLPNFKNGEYREGVISEDDSQVTFEFYTPYIIAAAPASNAPWGIYEPGGQNGLVLHGKADCSISISTDQGRTWQDCGKLHDGLDLTDHVKGRRQYFLRAHSGAKALQTSGLKITTVCQANPSTMPRLKENGSVVTWQANDRAVVSAGPNLPQAAAHIVDGSFASPKVTLELSTPRGESPIAVYAAGHVMSGNPPNPESKYRIDLSADDGKTWLPMVSDWTITRRGNEPKGFWSQSLCWGSANLPANSGPKVRVRFSNDSGRKYGRAEAHLVYRTPAQDSTRITFAWSDAAGEKKDSHIFPSSASATQPKPWTVPTGANPQTRWIEFEPVASSSR
jgi:hypothetical protein